MHTPTASRWPLRTLCVLIAALFTASAATAVPKHLPGSSVHSRITTAKKAAAAVPQAAPAPQPAQLVRELGGITEYKLANGLQLLLMPDEAQSTTTVNITYRVGSRHEAPGEYGMAHLLEHMVFKGTPNHKDIPAEFAQRGMRWNGSTTTDRTNYFASFNANADTLAFAIALEADRMRNSFIAKADLDKEMTVVRNEFERGETQPNQVLNQRVTAAAYAWHPYGHATIGPKSDIEGVPVEKLKAFYLRYYRPDNATLLIAGRFDPAAAIKLVEAAFNPVARPAEPVPVPYTEEPPQDGERSVVVRRVGGQPMLQAYYHVPAMAHADTAAVLVYQLLMSMQPAGHLYKSLVETKQAVWAGMGGLGGFAPGGTSAYAVLPPDADVAKVEQQLLDEVEGRSGTPFTEDEIQRVRDLALMSYREQMKNPEALIGQISTLLGAGDWRLLFQLMDDIPKVTLADVQRVRQAYFKPANRTLGRYLPATEVERVAIPATPPLDERLAQLKPPPKVEAGEQITPTAEVLGARSVFKTLPSGIQLQTLPKRTRGNAVSLLLSLRWATAEETVPRKGTSMVGQLVPEGSPSITKQKLQDEMTRLHAQMHVSSGNQGATLMLQAEQGTLLEALKLAADVMQHPLLPADAFERMRQQQIAGMQASRQELDTLRQEATRGLYNRTRGLHLGQPDYIPSLDENLAEMQATTLDDVRSVFNDLWSANDARVSVVGALPEGLELAIEQLLGSWKKPAAPAYVRHTTPPVTIAPARFDVQAKDKANAIVRMDQRFALNEADADYLPMLLAVHVLGGGTLESRLATRVRRQEGLSYGLGASLQAGYWGRNAALVIGGSYAPQNRERLLAAVREELDAYTQTGPTEAELARAKHDILEGWLQGRAHDSNLASALGFFAEANLNWSYEAAKEAKLSAVTLAQVNTAWRKLVKPDGFVVSTAGDFQANPPAANKP